MVMRTYKYLFISLILLAITQIVSAQSSGQKVRDAVNNINQMVDEVHQLAAQNDIDNAFKKLNEINRAFSTETTWSTFDEEYRNAKLENPSFDYQLRSDLPAKLDPSFWRNYQQRCDRIMADQNQALEGFKSMMELNKWDKIMAYGAQIKNSYETIKNATENLASGNIPGFAYDLYNNMNDFIKNYTKIENAEIAGVDIQTQKREFQNMISKAEMNKSLYRSFESTINVNIDMVHTFQSNIKYVNDRKADASQGPLKPLQPTLDYLWNYEFYEKNIKEICDAMEDYEVKCAKLKEEVDANINDARRDWRRVDMNIKTSDDEANKARYLSDNKELWDEFENKAKSLYNEAYQLYCVDNSAGSDNSTNPFDGASAQGSASVVETPQEESNSESEDNSMIPNNSTYIGTISAGGGHGKYATLEIKYFKNNDRIVFEKKSGTLKYVQVIWRKQGGIWETAYQGNKTDIKFSDLKDKMPGGTTHLNFVVNAHHNRWSTSDVACEMDVYLVSSENHSSASDQSTTEETNGGSNATNSSASDSNNSQQKTFIGRAVKKGNTGKYVAIDVTKLHVNDRIRIVPVSGKLTETNISWLSREGNWKTLSGAGNLDVHNKEFYDTRIDNKYKNMLPTTTHVIVVVNSFRNNWNSRYSDAEADVYIVHGGGDPIVDPSKTTPGTQPNIVPNNKTKENNSNNSGSPSIPKNETPNNTVNKEFNELIAKARESFNKKYWEEEQGTRVSSNPKQESLNYLVKASRLINREPDIKAKYNMVYTLVSTSTQFAQRVYAYENKVPFINLAGRTANSAGSQVSSIQDDDPEKKKELKKYAYSKIAASWRAVRDATLVQGGTNYSKESCDQQYLKFKNLSER